MIINFGEIQPTDAYTQVNNYTIFEVEKPYTHLGIGINALPGSVRESHILAGNNLGQLANVQEIPSADPAFEDDRLKKIIQYYSINPAEMEDELHLYAKELLDAGNTARAWQVLLSGDVF